MTMSITMIQTRMGESGSLLTAGNTYSVSDAFGLAMIGAGYATDTNNVRRQALNDAGTITSYTAAQLTALAAAGELTPWAAYVASDTGEVYDATSASTLAKRLSGAQVEAALWGAGVKRPSFIVKPDGGAISATATPNTATEMCVFSSPVPYYAVRLHVQHWGGAGAIGPMTGFKALIGASDDLGTLDFSDLTAANFKKCTTPRRGGTEYNVPTNPFAAGANDGSPGWKAVTWAGAASVSIADPGAGNVGWASSDIIYERGVLDSTWGVYPLLIRYYFGSAGYTYVSNLTGQQTGLNLAADFPTRPLVHLSRSGGDYVSTPASWAQANNPNLTSSGANIFLEFFTASGVVSVQMCGDSRMAVNSELSATRAYASTELHLHNAINARGYAPAIVRTGINGGGSLRDNLATSGSFPVGPNYWVDGVGVQALPQPSTWLVYQTYTVNDGAVTDALMALVLARTADIASRARAKGQKVLGISAWPKDSGFTGAELTKIASLKAALLTICDVVIDPISLYGDASGAWALYRFDSSHMTDAGYRDFASRIAGFVCG